MDWKKNVILIKYHTQKHKHNKIYIEHTIFIKLLVYIWGRVVGWGRCCIRGKLGYTLGKSAIHTPIDN